MNKTTPITPLILLALFLTFGSSALFARAAVGEQAPRFSATTLDERAVSLDHYLQQGAVYLVFWATWCPNCEREIPHLKAIQSAFSGRLAVVGVNIGVSDTLQAAKGYQREHAIGYDLLFDKDQAITKAYRVRVTPTQLMISQQGEILFRGHSGGLSIDQIEALVAQ